MLAIKAARVPGQRAFAPAPFDGPVRGQVVALEGPSGAGKTRATRAVAHRLGALPIEEAYRRLEPTPEIRWRTPAELLRLERQLLAEEGRRYREARELAAVGALVLADTGFLGPLTYTRALVDARAAPPRVLQNLVSEARRMAHRGQWGLPDAILTLRTPPVERARRAGRDPLGHPPDLQATYQTVGEGEMRVLRDLLRPRYGARFQVVSGTGAASDVVRRLEGAVRRVVARPLPRVDLLRLLLEIDAGAGVP